MLKQCHFYHPFDWEYRLFVVIWEMVYGIVLTTLLVSAIFSLEYYTSARQIYSYLRLGHDQAFNPFPTCDVMILSLEHHPVQDINDKPTMCLMLESFLSRHYSTVLNHLGGVLKLIAFMVVDDFKNMGSRRHSKHGFIGYIYIYMGKL